MWQWDQIVSFLKHSHSHHTSTLPAASVGHIHKEREKSELGILNLSHKKNTLWGFPEHKN